MAKNDPLQQVRQQLREHVEKNYRTVEEFCWVNDLNKATVSNFLNERKDFRVSTLQKIATAMKKRLVIGFE